MRYDFEIHLGVYKVGVPGLKNKYRPKKIPMVSAPRDVIFNEISDHFILEKRVFLEFALRQIVTHPGFQRSSKPGADGGGEPHLGTVNEFGG